MPTDFDDVTADALAVMFAHHGQSIDYTPFGEDARPISAIVGSAADSVQDSPNRRLLKGTLELSVQLSDIPSPARQDQAVIFGQAWICDSIISNKSGIAVLLMKLPQAAEITPGYRQRR